MTKMTHQQFASTKAAKAALAEAGFAPKQVARATGFGVYQHEDGRLAQLGMHPVRVGFGSATNSGHATFIAWHLTR